MLDIRSTIPEAGAWRPLSVLAVAVMTIVVACSDGDSATVATAAPTDADVVEEPTAEDAPVDASPAVEAGADEAGADEAGRSLISGRAPGRSPSATRRSS